MVCSRTLYNMVWKGRLCIQPTELPKALKRKTKKHPVRENKKCYGESISDRPEIACLRLEVGHWESDTVVGKKAGKESVVFSLLEKKTETYLAFRIHGKTSEAVIGLMNTLHEEFGDHFSQIFKTITAVDLTIASHPLLILPVLPHKNIFFITFSNRLLKLTHLNTVRRQIN